MKKIFAIVLTLALVMSMSTVAFAAEDQSDCLDDYHNSASYPVNAMISDNEDEVVVISTDITYGGMTFDWVAAGTPVWDPATHTYISTDTEGNYLTEGEWVTNDDNTITVHNHSNVALNVTFTPEVNEDETGVTINCDITEYELDRGIVNTENSEDLTGLVPTVTSTVSLYGEPTSLETEADHYEPIGQIVVAIAPVA